MISKDVWQRIKYPKFLLLLLTFVVAYLLFKKRDFLPFHSFILSTGYFGAFVAGMGFAYGFTAAPATAILLILAKQQNIILAGLIAGFGALLGDLLIFGFIRYSFRDEAIKLSRERIILYINNKISKFPIIKKYLMLVIASIIIASPLPDEIGASLLAISYKIKTRTFAIISYILNTAGIFIILLIGRVI